MLVYDYAVGGHTVSGVRSQVEHWFLPNVGQRPEWAPWANANSLFGVYLANALSSSYLTHSFQSDMGGD